MRESGNGRRLLAVVAGCGVALWIGCASGTHPAGLPEHCDEETEWYAIEAVDEQMMRAHDSDGDGVPDRWLELLDRSDYLNAQCMGLNAWRADPPAD